MLPKPVEQPSKEQREFEALDFETVLQQEKRAGAGPGAGPGAAGVGEGVAAHWMSPEQTDSKGDSSRGDRGTVALLPSSRDAAGLVAGKEGMDEPEDDDDDRQNDDNAAQGQTIQRKHEQQQQEKQELEVEKQPSAEAAPTSDGALRCASSSDGSDGSDSDGSDSDGSDDSDSSDDAEGGGAAPSSSSSSSSLATTVSIGGAPVVPARRRQREPCSSLAAATIRLGAGRRRDSSGAPAHTTAVRALLGRRA
jgi:hypothetical protein